MTRKEAAVIVGEMASGSRSYGRPKHFWDECSQEGFTVQDINPILRSHSMRGAPEALANGAHRVRLSGKCLEGRRTILVVDLRPEGECALVSIMVDNYSPRRRRRTR
jgi:hypothetical protein